MLRGTNVVHGKTYNLRVVLETVRRYGRLSRADIARLTNLSRPAVSDNVRQLIDQSLLQEVGSVKRGRGSPATQLELKPSGAYSVGLNFDPGHLTAVLCDLTGNILQLERQFLRHPTSGEAFELFTEAVELLLARQGVANSDVLGLGLGFPGLLKASTRGRPDTVNPVGLPSWGRVELVPKLQDRLRMPIFLANDATAAAIGEYWYGLGKKHSSFFYTYYSRGLGGGIVNDGRPLEGLHGNAGEIAAIPVATASGFSSVGEITALVHLIKKLAAEGIEVESHDELLPLFQAGQPTLMAWLETIAEYFCVALAAVEHILDVEFIVLGGRLPPSIAEWLRRKVETALASRRNPLKDYGPKLLLAEGGTEAAALGLATLPIFEAFAPKMAWIEKKVAGGLMTKVGSQSGSLNALNGVNYAVREGSDHQDRRDEGAQSSAR